MLLTFTIISNVIKTGPFPCVTRVCIYTMPIKKKRNEFDKKKRKKKRSKKSDEALTRLRGVGRDICDWQAINCQGKTKKGKEKHVSSRLCIHNTQTMVPPLCTQTAQSATKSTVRQRLEEPIVQIRHGSIFLIFQKNIYIFFLFRNMRRRLYFW